MLGVADRQLAGWAYWSYDGGGWGPWDFDAEREQSPAIDHLIRPYPRTVGGRPVSWTFVPDTRRDG